MSDKPMDFLALALAVIVIFALFWTLIWQIAEADAGEPPEWSALIAWYFDADEVQNALDIMECESGGDPTAYNPSGATGLFQIKPEFWSHLLRPGETLYNPEANVRVASVIVAASGGWKHWTCKRVLAKPATSSYAPIIKSRRLAL